MSCTGEGGSGERVLRVQIVQGAAAAARMSRDAGCRRCPKTAGDVWRLIQASSGDFWARVTAGWALPRRDVAGRMADGAEVERDHVDHRPVPVAENDQRYTFRLLDVDEVGADAPRRPGANGCVSFCP